MVSHLGQASQRYTCYVFEHMYVDTTKNTLINEMIDPFYKTLHLELYQDQAHMSFHLQKIVLLGNNNVYQSILDNKDTITIKFFKDSHELVFQQNTLNFLFNTKKIKKELVRVYQCI